jgi:hypothetical protein
MKKNRSNFIYSRHASVDLYQYAASMKKAAFLTVAATCLPSLGSAGELELAVATRTPFAMVTTSSGLGTKDARATGEFTAASKREQCEGYNTEIKEIEACVASWNANLPKVVSASADCPAGTLFFAGGGRYQYLGEWPETSDGKKITKWRAEDQRIVDLGMASEGYPLDQNWRTLCPGANPKVAKSGETGIHRASIASPEKQPPIKAGEISGRPWMHNGSEVVEVGDTLVYNRPKASIRSAVKPGAVLFKGNLLDGKVQGTAFAFKDGCPPAPYPVKGTYSDHMYTLTLRGAGPIRQGCDVVGYSDRSPHAVLKFSYVLND